MSNAPGKDDLLYGQGFFPFSETIDLEEGDDISVRIKAQLVGDDYVWNWEARVFQREDPQQVKAHARQSTFHGTPISLCGLHKRSPEHVPQLNSRGEMARFVLDLMDRHLSNGEIARKLFDRFPSRLSDLDAAQSCVNDLAVQFSLAAGSSKSADFANRWE